MESSICEAAAKEVLQNTPGLEDVGIVILASPIISYSLDQNWPIKDLISKVHDINSKEFYRLGVYLLRDSNDEADWIAETQYRVGIIRADYERTGLSGSLMWIWLCHAAHRGHAKAQIKIYESYRDGKAFLKANPIKAYMWLNLASTSDSENVREELEQFRREFTEQTAKEAEQLAADWKPDPAACEHEIEESSQSFKSKSVESSECEFSVYTCRTN